VGSELISFAQNFEDVLLSRVFRDRSDGFYIDVGAMDPCYDSVTRHFYDKGWCGINIEPAKMYFDMLCKARPRDINLDIAVGAQNDILPFFEVSKSGTSTLRSDIAKALRDGGGDGEERFVTVRTLQWVCEQYVKRPIDFLKIDAEGWEEKVILGADFDKYRPRILIIEATSPNTQVPSWQEWQPLLEERGYECVYWDGLNRFYARREDDELRKYFVVPANTFDQFRLYATIEAERERDELRQQLIASEQDRAAMLQEILRLRLLLENKWGLRVLMHFVKKLRGRR
jgi:FkbM family methyltransferase